jgi:kynurenine 3-monooxygenase
MPENTVTIAGAGLAGTLLAILLANRGYRVEVFEKRPDLRKHDIAAGRSINLALANRGIRALQLAGIADGIRPMTIPMRGRMLHDHSGETRLQPYGQQPHEVIYSIGRGDLNAALLTAAEATGKVRIHFESAIEAVDLRGKRLQACGRWHAYERLIGADGAGSRIRQALAEAWSNDPDAYQRTEWLDHAYKELTIESDAKGHFRMEPRALHIWPRGQFMLIALPNLDGSFTVTLFMPREGDVSFASLQTDDAISDFFAREFPDAHPLMPGLLETFRNNLVGRLGTVRSNRWHWEDSVLLLGDAAHAIVPFHGQGMNCAFEDTYWLFQLLDRFGDNWAEAIPAFTRLRMPSANAIADMALENYVEMRDSVRDPRFELKKHIGWELEQRFPGRFVPRYAMVMFHHLPYEMARDRGQLQARLLEDLASKVACGEAIDWDKAGQWVRGHLPEIPEHWLQLKAYFEVQEPIWNP